MELMNITPRKIAILGSAETTRDLAPFDDPSWEIWGLTWRYRDHPRMDRCFEMHAERYWDAYAGDLYRAWLKDPRTFGTEQESVEVYLRPEDAAKYTKCKPFPIDEAVELLGVEYFTSSFSYMLALAVLEGVDEIGIWGVDLVVGEEYEYQRPNAEYLLGIARAKGIKLTIPWQSSLLKHSYVYGRDTPPEERPIVMRYAAKEKEYRSKIDDLKSQIYTLEGAAHECKEFVSAQMAIERGSLGGER